MTNNISKALITLHDTSIIDRYETMMDKYIEDKEASIYDDSITITPVDTTDCVNGIKAYLEIIDKYELNNIEIDNNLLTRIIKYIVHAFVGIFNNIIIHRRSFFNYVKRSELELFFHSRMVDYGLVWVIDKRKFEDIPINTFAYGIRPDELYKRTTNEIFGSDISQTSIRVGITFNKLLCAFDEAKDESYIRKILKELTQISVINKTQVNMIKQVEKKTNDISTMTPLKDIYYDKGRFKKHVDLLKKETRHVYNNINDGYKAMGDTEKVIENFVEEIKTKHAQWAIEHKKLINEIADCLDEYSRYLQNIGHIARYANILDHHATETLIRITEYRMK